MQIIPVLDIRRGQVVHARGGERELYQPIHSQLTQHVALINVLQDLLAWYEFETIYIADLDAIELGQISLSLYQQLSHYFPQLNIWLDAGIKDKDDFIGLTSLTKISPVIASETLMDVNLLLDEKIRQQCILSLDKKGEKLLAKIDILEQAAYWPDKVIAMQLANVGSAKGPAYDWISFIQNIKPQTNVYAAGGVRNMADLENLQASGVSGVLVASALHSGAIKKEALKSVIDK